jgi:hypothetical protein
MRDVYYGYTGAGLLVMNNASKYSRVGEAAVHRSGSQIADDDNDVMMDIDGRE